MFSDKTGTVRSVHVQFLVNPNEDVSKYKLLQDLAVKSYVFNGFGTLQKC